MLHGESDIGQEMKAVSGKLINIQWRGSSKQGEKSKANVLNLKYELTHGFSNMAVSSNNYAQLCLQSNFESNGPKLRAIMVGWQENPDRVETWSRDNKEFIYEEQQRNDHWKRKEGH